MEETNRSIKAIQDWQDWYRNNRVVAEMDQPLVTKASRENLHDTSKTAESLLRYDARTAAYNDISDTLASYMGTLGGKEFYKIFFEAAQEYTKNLEDEYKQAKDLMDRLRYRTTG